MKLWGGRFKKEPDQVAADFTASISFDWRLAPYDVKGSIAHAEMLSSSGIISADDADKIIDGLEKIAELIKENKFDILPDDEDIHTAVERVLHDIVGKTAGKLHTARSRNDQVATDMRLYVKDASLMVMNDIQNLQQTILKIADENIETAMPGMTHLQNAQPVSFAHHLMAYFWMLERDWRRFRCCYNHSDWSPLGAAALAGTGFPIDRQQTAKELGFANVIPNSVDAVSDRDFIVLFQAMSSLLITHLSRLAEEIVLWSGSQFSFIELDDAFATGSSIMPQKKNPDIAELARGKAGRVFGHLQAILTTLKGLPLAYNRDLQEDKEGVFDTFDTLIKALPSLNGMLATMKINRASMLQAAENGFATATDIADYLAEKGIPFREGHEITGNIIKYCVKNSLYKLSDISLIQLQEFSPVIEKDIFAFLTPMGSISRRSSYGGTAPKAVRVQIEEAKAVMGKQAEWLKS